MASNGHKILENGDHAPVIPVQSDGVADSDFANTPPDGTIAIGNDGTNDGIYVRVGGTWKHVDVA